MSPKLHFRNSGLPPVLLGLFNFDQLLGRPAFALSWERFVLEQLIELSPQDSWHYFVRTAGGAEIGPFGVPPSRPPVPGRNGRFEPQEILAG